MFRAQLEEQRRFRLDQLAELRAADPDSAGDVTDVLAAGARAALHAVLAALDRMERGTYGVCTDCGAQVPAARLEVLPQVAQCLPCRSTAAPGTGH
jgi:RNA polymerase-binding transcription factor DksA